MACFSGQKQGRLTPGAQLWAPNHVDDKHKGVSQLPISHLKTSNDEKYPQVLRPTG